MIKIFRHLGKILARKDYGSKIAINPNCCCNQEAEVNCCIYNFHDVKFTAILDCGDGNQTQHTGTLNFGMGVSDDGEVSVMIVCTTQNATCPGKPGGYGFFAAVDKMGCFMNGEIIMDANPDGDEQSYPCPNAESGAGQSFELYRCNAPEFSGTLNIG